MKHIQQTEGHKNCGVCAIAMITNRTYEEVLQYVPPCVNKHGLWVTHMSYALQFLTRKEWSTKYFGTPYPKQLSLYDFPKEPALYGIFRTEANWTFHYIVCDGEYLYDPLLPDKITLEQARLDYHSGWSLHVEIKL